jgi:MFS family permease
MITERKTWSIFYVATLLFACAECFFLTLSLYINHLGGNEKLTGFIFTFQAIGAITLIPLGGIIIRYIKVVYLIIAGITLFAIGSAIFWLCPLNLPLYFLAGALIGAGWA